MPFIGKVIENKEYENDIHILKITFPEIDEFSHAPGQFAILVPNGIGRAYSIANYPASDYLEFCIRKVHGGKVSPLLCSMKPGDKLLLEAPFGDFVINEKVKNNLIFICSGTGIAPIKAMLEFLIREEMHKKRKIILIYGCREKEHPYFGFLKSLSQQGVEIRITDDVEKSLSSISTLKGFEAYICGSREFVRKMIELCTLKDAEKIKYEKCIFSNSELKKLGEFFSFLPE